MNNNEYKITCYLPLAKMNTIRKILIGILITVVVVIVIFIFAVIFTYESTGKCGMSSGPCYGRKINVDLSKTIIDTFLIIPDGQLAISNTNVDEDLKDTIPPIIIKLDKRKNIIWAVKLYSDECGIAFYEMSSIFLHDNKSKKEISFFNVSYEEHGTIFLTENFDFEYMCLDPL